MTDILPVFVWVCLAICWVGPASAQVSFDAPPRPTAQPTAEVPGVEQPGVEEPAAETPEEPAAAEVEADEPDEMESLNLGVGYSTDERLQNVFLGKEDPNLDDLRQLQFRVNELVEKLRPAVVGIRMQDGQGSGVIVTSDGYILTAAHVVGSKGLPAQVVMPDGSTQRAVVLGTNAATDSGMLRLLDKGPWPYVPVGESGTLNEGQWVMALGHPGGFDPDRDAVVRVGRMLTRPGRTTLQTDCTLVGGDSGGPLFDLDGYVIGIHSRISRRIQQNYHVAVDVFTSNWDEMAEDPKIYFGFSLKSKTETELLLVSDVEGPVARAGMKVGDQLLKVNGKDVATREDIRDAITDLEPFDDIEIVVRRKVPANAKPAEESNGDESSEDEQKEDEPEQDEMPEPEYEEVVLNVEVGTQK